MTITIALVSFLASLLTFFSGFGLGTLLTPVFAIFFPVETAIALTAIVHFSNNLFKLGLIGRQADRSLLLRFGIPSILGAFAGAWLLTRLSANKVIFSYDISDRIFYVQLLDLIIGLLIIGFTLFDMSPVLKNKHFRKEHYVGGGLLSGFFGGLSGNQGALRSMFLVKSAISKESFIATGVVIACLVDITRLSIYSPTLVKKIEQDMISLLVIAALAAFAGAFLGKRLLKKMTFDWLQKVVSVFLLLIGLALVSGVL